MDAESLANRILHDLNVILRRDPDIVEFDVIAGEDVRNKSPFILEDHRLALLSWCVKHVYSHLAGKLTEARISNPKITNTTKTNLQEDLHQWTRFLLLINPDYTTAWNIRKELLQTNFLNPRQELKFSELLLTRKPKSPDNFNHRQWIIRSLKTINSEVIVNELRVSLDAASRYQRNYYAWSHRMWMIKNYASANLDIIQSDLLVTEHWLEGHISDYSCFHYRQFIFNLFSSISTTTFLKPCGSQDSNDDGSMVIDSENNASNDGALEMDGDDHSDNKEDFYKMLLQKELQLINGLFQLYPDQESLFQHRKYLLYSLVKVFSHYGNQNSIDSLFRDEVSFIEQQFSRSIRTQVSNAWHLIVMKRHTCFLKRVLHWELGC